MYSIAADNHNQITESKPARIARWAVLAAFPISLTSPGATVAMAITALCGLWLWKQVKRLPGDIVAGGKVAAAAYVLLVVVDLGNGGDAAANLLQTGVNYLPVLALAPLAFAIRLSGVTAGQIDRSLQLTILIAPAISIFGFATGEPRPGGVNLNPIPYGFAILLSSSLLLWRGLEVGVRGVLSVALALLALLPILLTGSKIVWACAIAAYSIASAHWIISNRKWAAVIPVVLVAASGAAIAYHAFAKSRLEYLWLELQEFADNGISMGGSFGRRAEMAIGGWNAFLERPILGYGLDERMAAVFAHARPGGPDLTIHNHMHNDYVTHLVAYGISGGIFLAVYFGLLLWLAANAKPASYKWFGYTLAVMLAIYMTAEVAFNMDPVSGPMAVFLALLLASRTGLGSRPDPTATQQ
ncbi:MAG: hypothetical protein Rhirs2KO_14000 [Rhizobiaceae bacterium]